MTLDKFLEHIQWGRRAGPANRERVARAYAAYYRAYSCSFMALVGLSIQANADVMMRLAVFAAARDRDERKRPAVVEELEPKEEKNDEDVHEE